MVTESCDLPQPLVDACASRSSCSPSASATRSCSPRGAERRRVLAAARADQGAPGDGRAVGRGVRARFRELHAGGATASCASTSPRTCPPRCRPRKSRGGGGRRHPGAGHRLKERVDGLGNLCLTAAAGAPPTATRSIDRAGGGRPPRPHQALRHARHARIPQARRPLERAAPLGTVLSIKPVVEVREGIVEEAGKVRTRQSVKLLAAKAAEGKIEHLAVLHGNAPDLDELLELLHPSSRATTSSPGWSARSSAPTRGPGSSE